MKTGDFTATSGVSWSGVVNGRKCCAWFGYSLRPGASIGASVFKSAVLKICGEGQTVAGRPMMRRDPPEFASGYSPVDAAEDKKSRNRTAVRQVFPYLMAAEATLLSAVFLSIPSEIRVREHA